MYWTYVCRCHTIPNLDVRSYEHSTTEHCKNPEVDFWKTITSDLSVFCCVVSVNHNQQTPWYLSKHSRRKRIDQRRVGLYFVCVARENKITTACQSIWITIKKSISRCNDDLHTDRSSLLSLHSRLETQIVDQDDPTRAHISYGKWHDPISQCRMLLYLLAYNLNLDINDTILKYYALEL